MSLPEIESHLTFFETTLKEFDLDLQSKSSNRVLTNSVWMQEKIQSKLDKQLKPLLLALERLQGSTKDSGIENNIQTSIKHTKELIKHLEDVLMTYRQAAGITDMKIKWAHSLEKMKEHAQHLRNRTNIIKGLKAQEKDPRKWLPF